MVAATRTLGPLHFEDLEPKRFEDLARQLVYDFKPWRRLEATGRAGSDDGFDARGYEMAKTSETDESDELSEEAVVAGADDRLWLVQCKRERVIGPKKLMAYLDEIRLGEGEQLHGIVFTAACDFSKAARDKFRDRCEMLGLKEWHLWGKAELEDRLLRPENDGLLFAYFGVSLTIRRRSLRTDLRAKLVMKRKANRLLGPKQHSMLLLRSPDAVMYPNADGIAGFSMRPPWVVRRYLGLDHDGLKFSVHRHFAYLSDDGKSWDAMFVADDSRGAQHEDPWNKMSNGDNHRQDAWAAWNEMPEQNRAWFEVVGIVRFEDVLDIDEIGDEYVEEPHVYALFNGNSGPFALFYASVTTIDRWNERRLWVPDPKGDRVQFFPAHLREKASDVTLGRPERPL